MSQQPFSRPGAVDLSGFSGPGSAGQPGAAPQPGGAPVGSSGPYSLEITTENFQSVLESSRTAPVLLAFYSRTQMPDSARLAADLATLSAEFEGRFLAGLVDIDAQQEIAQAMQIPQVPLVVAVIDGRPMPLLQDAPPIDELRTALNQVMQQLTTQGIAGRHQPMNHATEGDVEQEDEIDPRYAPAQDALAAGDIDLAVAEYQKLIDANPADTEATAGLAMAKVLQRTQGVDLNTARAAAAEDPDDIDAQTLVADLDMLGGHVEDSFLRLVDLVRRTAGKDRDKARNHLIGLFAAVGNDDPRVTKGRQSLASALF
ncbi:MAG: tetratricopeptide repeat protein [Nocardioides sp.]|nr:tetratricopeptide repeat protein [Nocardioides sp.]